MGKTDKETLNRLLKAVESNPSFELHIVKFILKENDRIKKFINDHNLPDYLFIPFGKIFFHLNVPGWVRKIEQMITDDTFKIKYLDRQSILMQLKEDKELQKFLDINEEKMEKTFSFGKMVLENPMHKRITDKTVLKGDLHKVFRYLKEEGFSQKEQINIIMDLFEQEGFEDYKDGWTKQRFDRIRKTFYEPAIK